MNYLFLQQHGFFSELAKRFYEGGPLFMSLILICFILAFVFLALGFYNAKRNVNLSIKMAKLTSDVSILGLVLGLLGSTIGMIMAFDAIDALGNASQSMIAGGLKVSFLTTVFGSITFILPRIGIVILRILQKS
ncbi:MotA/TolQ/ExbB proton channel family protein [Aestuariibaculum sediminum]|uniref:MotA/TolQ/ExbB proton channel family protein n=1 Tax=Aestuariibaculum sediminum TaxID=2770637 RepID=A0A8J6U7D8_9FLAO|nr:MotA/TolQ/ExbB proton channel family protein [Aestuariibaculum sediminum]MBD0831750.1 MotA/TolQ/ExbB proton channel family protein [Aestuariibaculum sediminum]